MNLRPFTTDLALSALAGYLGTKAMEPVSMKLYQRESAQSRAREDAVRPGPPYRIAAAKLTNAFGVKLTDEQLDRLSLVFHYGLAIQWAALYPLLRRTTTLNPVATGLATGAGMSVIADELMTPAFGFSAPNLDYPLVTHARGLAAHLIFGLSVAAVVEAGWRALGTQRSPTR